MSESETPGSVVSPRQRRPGAFAILLVISGLVIAALSVALVLAFMGRGGGTPVTVKPTAGAATSNSPATVTVRGTVTMDRYDEPGSEFRSTNWRRVGKLSCEGTGGYDDMGEGVTVAVYNAASTVVGIGNLNPGLRVGEQCMWVFEVPNVPDLSFYQIEVSHRGKVPVQRADVGSVSLSLG